MQAQANSIVSSESELLILVDADDQETGGLNKSACHDGEGILHRAFSVFLFNAQGELLLQQRAAGKRLSRHTPHLYNLAWAKTFFWDGRATGAFTSRGCSKTRSISIPARRRPN